MLPRPLSEEESVRKRAWVLVVAMVAFLLVGGAGALGQPKNYSYPRNQGTYGYHNGTVIIGGDIGVPCRMFASKEFYPSDATGAGAGRAGVGAM